MNNIVVKFWVLKALRNEIDIIFAILGYLFFYLKLERYL